MVGGEGQKKEEMGESPRVDQMRERGEHVLEEGRGKTEQKDVPRGGQKKGKRNCAQEVGKT